MIRRLNWGCSGDARPGWINSDIKQSRGIDLPCDARVGLGLRSECLEYAVSIHALQEIPLDEQVAVLRELRRVLKPGGVLRLVLPDFEKGVAAYQRGDREYFAVPDEDASSLGGKLVTQLLWYGYSRTMYTFDFIEELALKSGFRTVERCAFGRTASAFPEITLLDNRERESLFVEAFR
jgi:SAM-dependent methyltransferase